MRPVFALCLVLVSGCAGIECGDPYELGLRQGRLNADQAPILVSRCPGFDESRYREGFAEGFARRPPPNW